MSSPAIQIQAVGIKDIQLPVRIRERHGGLQNTVATVSMQARMPGAAYLPNTSAPESCVTVFTRALNRYEAEMSATIFSTLLEEVRTELQAESASIVMTFPYFIEKKAPVTGTRSLMEYNCTFTGSSSGAMIKGENPRSSEDFILSVQVPVTTLCPCSKEISAAGAHNQRAEVTFNVKFTKFIWVEELIEMVEQSASCPLYALLKRPDEKFVTEQAYNNPMFVEDVVRKVAVSALAHPSITWFSVGVESFESIHKHSAYAFVDSTDIQ